MSGVDEATPTVRRWLGWAAVSILLTAVVGIGILSAGFLDPQPKGQFTAEHHLAPIHVSAQSGQLVWLGSLSEEGQTTIRLSVAHADGEKDIGYGIAIGDESRHLVAAVSPLGYLGLWEQTTPAELGQNGKPREVIQQMLPWQVWPHVRTAAESNEIWVDVIDGQVKSIRINRELLWEGSADISGRQLGIWAESFGSPAVVDFQRLELFVDN